MKSSRNWRKALRNNYRQGEGMKKTQINSYIDSCEYNNNPLERSIEITGWCYSNDFKEVNYKCYFNDKELPVELYRLKREDVSTHFKLPADLLLSGFFIRVHLPKEEDVSKVELYAFTDEENRCILKLNDKSLKKVENTTIFHYAIDEYIQEKNETILTGYVYTNNLSNVSIEVLDRNKIKIEDASIQRIIRNDVVERYKLKEKNSLLGFVISFSNLEKSPYYLTFTLDNHCLTIPAELTQPLSNLLKSYYKEFSMDRLKNAWLYLQENGFRRFIQRIKLGPGKEVELSYNEWFDITKPTDIELSKQKEIKFKYEPLISVVVATYNTPEKFLKEMIKSLINQTYSNWELCIADGSDNDSVKNFIIKNYKDDQRIKFKKLNENLGIALNTNEAISMGTGEFIAFFDHDDLLTPDALFEVVKVLQDKNIEFIYSDEDKIISETNLLIDPYFKPDFNIDLLRSANYICHLSVVKADLLKKIGYLDPSYDGAQDYDLTFRIIEELDPIQIKHIPKVLYHWRMHQSSTASNPESKLYAFKAGQRAIEDHLKRQNINGKVSMGYALGMYNVEYSLKEDSLISIIIPNKDEGETLLRCVESLEHKSSYRNFEIIIVENNSTEKDTFEFYKTLEAKYENLKVVFWNDIFNYSAINNFGVSFSNGDYILLLNNDTELIEPDSLKSMLGICQRKEVGAVGARLLYPDDTIQHAGVIVGLGGIAGHAFLNTPKDSGGYFNRVFEAQDVSAVTAACMMVKKSVFEEVGGLYESLKVAFNDVDLCMKIRKADYLIVYDPNALFYHYESKSRGLEDTPEKVERFNSEIKTFEDRWNDFLEKGDPYYNPNLSLMGDSYTLENPDQIKKRRGENLNGK